MSNRVAFFFLMIAALFVKAAISMLVPASKDMADTVMFALSVGNRDALNGPWIMLFGQILDSWRFITASTVSPENMLAIQPNALPTDGRLLLLLLRLPTIVFDIGTATMLYYGIIKITASGKMAKLASLLWFLNPYTTFGVEMLGVPDIAAAFFTVVAFTFLLSKKPVLSGLALGAGIALKLYPIFFLPQVLFYTERNGEPRRSQILMLTLALLGFLAYFSWALQIGWAALRITVIDYTPVTTPIAAIFDFSPQARISVTAFALIALYFVTRSFAKAPKILVSDTILPVLLIYYTFSDIRPQYLIWALPFLTIYAVVSKRRHIVLLIITLALMFGFGLLLSSGYGTSSGYSLLLFPLQGQVLPWYSEALLSFFKDPIAPIVLFPLVRAALAATTSIYALEIIRSWFPQTIPQSEAAKSSE